MTTTTINGVPVNQISKQFDCDHRVLLIVLDDLSIKPILQHKHGDGKVFRIYDQRLINERAKEISDRITRRREEAAAAKIAHGKVLGQARAIAPKINLGARLDAIESKLDRLLAIWDK